MDSTAAVDVAGDGAGRFVRPADRLRRPAPGPVLAASGRSIPRTVEGYLWGGAAGRTALRRGWALLLPFALTNAAHRMLPPLAADRAIERTLGLLLRALVRTVALGLTCLLVAELTLVSAIVGARLGWPPGVALAPAAALVVLLRGLSRTPWVAPPAGPGTGTPAGPRSPAPGLPATPLAGSPDAPALRVLHVVAGASTAAFVAGGGFVWWGALVLLAVAVGATVLLDDPTGATVDRGGRRLRALLSGRSGSVLVVAAGAALGHAAVVGPVPVAAAADLVRSTCLLLAVLVAAVAVLLVPAARLAGRTWAALPRSVRPWAGGWFAAPVLALAVLLGAGTAAALTTATRWATDTGSSSGTALVAALLAGWGAAGALAVVAALVATVWWVVRGRSGAPVELPLLHAASGATVAAWWRAGLVRDHAHQLLVGTVAVLVAGATVALWLPPPAWTRAAGVAVLAGVAVVVLRVAGERRGLPRGSGVADVLWQLVSCWPREAHPVVPPSHPLRAVPELVRRARGHLDDPSTRVVLCGDGHGALLATVAAARLIADLPDADRERVGLVTAGAPLLWAHSRAFPSVVPHSCLVELSGRLDGRWRALCRGTDPVGGGVTTWRRQVFDGALLGVGFRTENGTPTVGALAAATRTPDGALVLGGDHWLPDPAPSPRPGRRWRAGILGHRDYLADPEWDRAVALAAGLTPATTDGARNGIAHLAFSRGPG